MLGTELAHGCHDTCNIGARLKHFLTRLHDGSMFTVRVVVDARDESKHAEVCESHFFATDMDTSISPPLIHLGDELVEAVDRGLDSFFSWIIFSQSCTLRLIKNILNGRIEPLDLIDLHLSFWKVAMLMGNESQYS